MLTDLKDILTRQAPTLAGDIAGGAALFVMLLVGLFLPAAF